MTYDNKYIDFDNLSDKASQDIELIKECKAKLEEIDQSIECNGDREYEALLLVEKKIYQQAISNCKQELSHR